jgi:hypothetical protein
MLPTTAPAMMPTLTLDNRTAADAAANVAGFGG